MFTRLYRGVLIQTLLWLLVIVTLRIAAPFFGCYSVPLLINRTEIHELVESA